MPTGQMKFHKAKWKLQIFQQRRERRGVGSGDCLAKLIYFEAWEIQFAWLSIRTGLSFNVIEYFKRFYPLLPSRAGKVSAWCLWMSESWRPATLSPMRPPQLPPPLSLATLTQPLAIEVEIYLLIAWILLDLCLESWALSPESCHRVAACAEVHTRLNTRCTAQAGKDMRAVKRSIRQQQLERKHCQRLARNFKFPGEFLQPELKEIVYACFWHMCVCVCMCVFKTI